MHGMCTSTFVTGPATVAFDRFPARDGPCDRLDRARVQLRVARVEISNAQLAEHCAVLGLGPKDLTVDKIRRRQRQAVASRHPDRLGDQTPEVQATATAGVARINQCATALVAWRQELDELFVRVLTRPVSAPGSAREAAIVSGIARYQSMSTIERLRFIATYGADPRISQVIIRASREGR